MREHVVTRRKSFARRQHELAERRVDAPEPWVCPTCDGAGWVSGIGADPLPSGEPGEPYQVQETCPDCGGAASR